MFKAAFAFVVDVANAQDMRCKTALRILTLIFASQSPGGFGQTKLAKLLHRSIIGSPLDPKKLLVLVVEQPLIKFIGVDIQNRSRFPRKVPRLGDFIRDHIQAVAGDGHRQHMAIAIKNLTRPCRYDFAENALPRNAIIHQLALSPLELHQSCQQNDPAKKHEARDQAESPRFEIGGRCDCRMGLQRVRRCCVVHLRLRNLQRGLCNTRVDRGLILVSGQAGSAHQSIPSGLKGC